MKTLLLASAAVVILSSLPSGCGNNSDTSSSPTNRSTCSQACDVLIQCGLGLTKDECVANCERDDKKDAKLDCFDSSDACQSKLDCIKN